MKIVVLCATLLLCILLVRAQDKTVEELKTEASKQIKKEPNDTIPKVWKKGGVFNINFNQAALSNWAAGGDNSSLSLASFFNAYAFYKKGKNAWDNTLDMAYGFVNTTSLGQRKSDDRFDLLSKYGYDFWKSWYIGVLFNFRTQFDKGYDYPGNNTKVLTSDIFAPAYILLSPGVNYKPNDNFSVFISPITARWVIVNNDSLASVGAYGVDSGQHVRTELGAFTSVTYLKKISASAVYSGRLDLFSNYLHNPQDISVYWTNLLAVKVTKLIAITITLNVIYDNDIKTVKSDGTAGGPAPQIQEVMGLGLSLKF
jgi:Protein of unknown function (DUF3078)